MPKQISFKHTTAPALVSGGIFYFNCGEYEKVTDFILGNDLGGVLSSGIGAVSGFTLKAYGVVVSGNQVRVNIEKTPTAMSGGAVVVAESGLAISNTFYAIVKGE